MRGSRLKHCKRSRFVDADDARGAEAEDWMYEHFLCFRHEDDVHWHNMYGRSYRIDFTLQRPFCHIEVERKAREWWWLGRKYGFDFLAPKVHQYIEWDDPVVYALVKGDGTVFVNQTVVAIMLYGQPIPLSRLRVKKIERF
jgi:hypothetical protein